jgi:hypothetical protein
VLNLTIATGTIQPSEDGSESEDYSSALSGPIEWGGHEHSKDDETLNPPEFEKNEHSDTELQSGKRNHEEDNIPTRSLIILLTQELSKNMFQVGWFAQNRTAVTAFVEEQWPISALDIWENALRIIERLGLADLLEWCHGGCVGTRPYPVGSGPAVKLWPVMERFCNHMPQGPFANVWGRRMCEVELYSIVSLCMDMQRDLQVRSAL